MKKKWWLLGGIGAGLGLVFVAKKAKAKLLPSPTPSSFAVVPGGNISSPYLQRRGTREDGSDIIHQGIDIKAAKGTPVNSVADGRINKFWLDGQVSGYGNTILVYHDDGKASLYAHLDSFAPIYEGMRVSKGEHIGFVGQTQKPRPEMKTAPHLHLEILAKQTRAINAYNPARLNPLTYLSKQNMTVG